MYPIKEETADSMCFNVRRHGVRFTLKMVRDLLCKLKHVKNKLFHFDAVRFVRCDAFSRRVYERNLLFGHMVRELVIVIPEIIIEED